MVLFSFLGLSLLISLSGHILRISFCSRRGSKLLIYVTLAAFHALLSCVRKL